MGGRHALPHCHNVNLGPIGPQRECNTKCSNCVGCPQLFALVLLSTWTHSPVNVLSASVNNTSHCHPLSLASKDRTVKYRQAILWVGETSRYCSLLTTCLGLCSHMKGHFVVLCNGGNILISLEPLYSLSSNPVRVYAPIFSEID